MFLSAPKWVKNSYFKFSANHLKVIEYEIVWLYYSRLWIWGWLLKEEWESSKIKFETLVDLEVFENIKFDFGLNVSIRLLGVLSKGGGFFVILFDLEVFEATELDFLAHFLI